MKIRPFLFCLGLVLQCTLHAQSNQVLNLSSPIDSFISLSHHAFLLADTSRSLSWQEANEAFENKNFLPYENFPWAEKYDRGRYAYWMLIDINTDSFFPEQEYIFYWLAKDSLELYVLENNLLQDYSQAGRRINNEKQNLVYSKKTDFLVSLAPGKNYRLLLRSSSSLEFTLGGQPQFFNKDFRNHQLTTDSFIYILF